MINEKSKIKKFDDIIQEEQKAIHYLRNENNKKYPFPTNQEELPKDLVGLAFSGGGIRSATFGLGVLEALKHFDLLRHVDYLSTVSGGGYIGAWLSANCKRTKDKRTEDEKTTQQPKEDPSWLANNANWDDSIRHLRKFSNYLSPNLSLLSADTWSMVTIWLRNTLLLQLMITMAIAWLLLIPRLFEPLILSSGEEDSILQLMTYSLSIFIFLQIIWRICCNLKKIKDDEEHHDIQCICIPHKETSQPVIQRYILLLILASAGVSSILWKISSFEYSLSYLECLKFPITTKNSTYTNLQSLLGFIIFPYVSLALLCKYSSRNPLISGYSYLYSWLVTIPATITWYLLLALTLYIMSHWKLGNFSGGEILAFSWGPPMILASISLTINILIGMQGKDSFEYIREWWSRFGAWLAIYGAAWMFVVIIAYYSPLWIEILYYDNSLQALSSSWIGTTIAGLLAGKSASTGNLNNTNKVEKIRDIFAKLAPFVFIIGLFIVVACALHFTLLNIHQSDMIFTESTLIGDSVEKTFYPTHPTHWILLAQIPWCYSTILFFACTLCVFIFSFRVDINEFSLNAFYRNRLARCYLGASNPDREPHNFTGFDDDDDFNLSDLVDTDNKLYGPFHIFNCALNLGGSSDLAMHTRHCASFTLTPFSIGSHYEIKKNSGRVEKEVGYLTTRDYGGQFHPTSVGQAISVSGAAASPNMGYHTSAPVAFLMTLFNARLGWWFRNPANLQDHKAVNTEQASPVFSLKYLLYELFGIANEKESFLAVSDGGHFENLAAHELIKRKCKVLIISDGECDPKMQFEGLANLIRLCEVDGLAKIKIDVNAIKTDVKTGWSQSHCAIGKIYYPPFNITDNANPDAWLIYIKASMTGNEDTPIKHYKDTHPLFPHETTGDQFYSEDQFESYRILGMNIAMQVFGKLDLAKFTQSTNEFKSFMPTIAEQLYNIFSPELIHKTQFIHHADRLIQIWEQLSQNEKLQDFDPESKPLDHFCNEIIQFIENVYLDLNLEETWDRDDNKGWMQLFKEWANNPNVNKVWQDSKETYGIRFSSFWNRQLQS